MKRGKLNWLFEALEGIIYSSGGFCVFLSQEKAKPAARQGRKITGLIFL